MLKSSFQDTSQVYYLLALIKQSVKAINDGLLFPEALYQVFSYPCACAYVSMLA